MGNPVGVKSVMRSTVSKYEQEQKEKFIQVMSDPRMRYSDALNFVENEIKQSKRMGTFNHKILCFMNDGVYQLNRAIQEVFGIVSAAKNDKVSVSSGLLLWWTTLSIGQKNFLQLILFIRVRH